MADLDVIAIDGVAGSGKSTTARLLAERLGYVHLNSGALYRLVALVHQQIFKSKPPEEGSCQHALESANISSSLSSNGRISWQLDGEVVDHLIAEEEVGNIASKIAVFPNVRAYVNEVLRTMASRLEGVVVEGRDIGSAVFPDAKLKIFLTASAEVRAARRSKDSGVAVGELRKSLEERDRRDSTRKVDPLMAADGATEIDTSSLSPQQVVGQISDLL